MGCLKLTYHKPKESLGVNWKIYKSGLEKNALEEKNCLSYSRYGFNGQEKDDEIKGSGNSYDFGSRIYDPRLGKWLSLDPMQSKFPSLSPYHAFGNSPIWMVDPDGKENTIYIYVSETAKKSPALQKVDNEVLATIVRNNIVRVSGKDNINVVIVTNPVTPAELDGSDAFVYIAGGTASEAEAEINSFDNQFTGEGGSPVFFGGNDAFDNAGTSGFGDRSTTNGDKNLIGINIQNVVDGYVGNNVSTEGALGFLITHGLGHNVTGQKHNTIVGAENQGGTFLNSPENYNNQGNHRDAGFKDRGTSSNGQKAAFDSFFGDSKPADNRDKNAAADFNRKNSQGKGKIVE